MRIKDIVKEDDSIIKTLKGELPGPFQIKVTSTDTGTYVTVKNTEPRGVPAQVISRLMTTSVSYAGKIIGNAKKAGVIDAYTTGGKNLKTLARRAMGTPPRGLIFQFHNNIDPNKAHASVMSMVSAAMNAEQKYKTKDDKWKAGAPGRRKEEDKFRRIKYQKDRQELFNKYGRKNVESVTARQIGGDDGYQWNVLINGQSMVNGLTQSQVSYYKTKAYELLLKKHGVQ